MFINMSTKNTNTTRLLARFFAGGILLSMVTFYLLHFFGTWEWGTERPDAETTSSVIVANNCAVLGDTHILRPGTSLTTNESSKQLKLAGSFMNFFDGHIVMMIVFAFVLALIMFVIKRSRGSSSSNPAIRSVLQIIGLLA
jgi:hypothetical protein